MFDSHSRFSKRNDNSKLISINSGDALDDTGFWQDVEEALNEKFPHHFFKIYEAQSCKGKYFYKNESTIVIELELSFLDRENDDPLISVPVSFYLVDLEVEARIEITHLLDIQPNGVNSSPNNSKDRFSLSVPGIPMQELLRMPEKPVLKGEPLLLPCGATLIVKPGMGNTSLLPKFCSEDEFNAALIDPDRNIYRKAVATPSGLPMELHTLMDQTELNLSLIGKQNIPALDYLSQNCDRIIFAHSLEAIGPNRETYYPKSEAVLSMTYQQPNTVLRDIFVDLGRSWRENQELAFNALAVKMIRAAAQHEFYRTNNESWNNSPKAIGERDHLVSKINVISLKAFKLNFS